MCDAAKLHQAELETADEMIGELLRLNDRYREALESIELSTLAGMTCQECGALVGHWNPCSNASPELQARWRASEQASEDLSAVPERAEKEQLEDASSS